jgi:hypothetical protein
MGQGWKYYVPNGRRLLPGAVLPLGLHALVIIAPTWPIARNFSARAASPATVRLNATRPVNGTLPTGKTEVTLTLSSGNFRPLDRGEPDPRRLSFAIRELAFTTHPH